MQQERSTGVWAEQGDVAEVLFQALATSFGSDLANLIIGIEASGNPRPLAGLSPAQLQVITGQLAEMGPDLRALDADPGYEAALDGAIGIVWDEMKAKAGPATASAAPEGSSG